MRTLLSRQPQGLLVLLILCAAPVPCAADTVQAESRITAVTVFADRAGVTRVARVTLPRGTTTLRVAPLPSHVDPASVTAKGVGEADVTLYGVRLVTTQLETPQDPRAKALEEDLRMARQRQQRLETLKQVLAREREYLDSIRAASSEQIGKDLITKSPSAADAESILAFLDAAYLKNLDRQQEAEMSLEELARHLDKLRRELAELAQGRHQQETAILVDLEAHQAGPFTLEVSYRLPGATWQSAYEARAQTASDQVELVSYGLVRQQTGEAWDDVRLTLSTAKPAMAGSMPDLEPWFLRPWQPVPVMSMAAQMKYAAAPAERGKADAWLEDRVDKVDEQEAKIAVAVVEAQGPAVTFTLPKPVSIPADWQPYKVPVGAQRFSATLAYETTPRLLPYAFLRAKVRNTTDTLLLPGSVSVFLDGAFVATASLKQVAPSEEFDLDLGVDERVKVERRQLKERVDVSLLPGLRGKMQSTDYEFLTTVENFTGLGITVTAFDQVPVSEREEILVESVQRSPGKVEQDPEKPGVFRWAIDLTPGQKQELRLSYRVRHPVDLQVQ